MRLILLLGSRGSRAFVGIVVIIAPHGDDNMPSLLNIKTAHELGRKTRSAKSQM